MTDAADKYRRRADAFEKLIDGTPADRWTCPSPCEGWTALDVVAHVVDFSAHVLGEKVDLADAPVFASFDDPGVAFRAARRAVERVLDDPATPPEASSYIQWSVGFDLPAHGWDLAVATGQDPTMDPDEVVLLWGAGDPKAFDWQREQGWFGPLVPVPDDAPMQDRALGLIGRDPRWSPPG